MSEVVTLLGALASPLLGLCLLLWLTHLEETLPPALESARRLPDPLPILAVQALADPVLAVRAQDEVLADAVPVETPLPRDPDAVPVATSLPGPAFVLEPVAQT